MLKRSMAIAVVMLLVGYMTLIGQEKGQNAEAQLRPKIAWYGKLKDGLEEARRSNRPIFLVSAAPQCEAVPGIW